ncbi:GNAT family N-acetyltransferase [Tardiphaga alba]|uniref:GNAT family N-acetyltransferase n=1 Tax=Tardiphaga alba TaxID=340268 RepID=A0ABX8A7Z5_9BRAD|nr:GNAT family N-acetyltransferase [Tardiphaga alba]QUS39759.1 GNAT family N-acetyltransferase [Tardiphaga alba]
MFSPATIIALAHRTPKVSTKSGPVRILATHELPLFRDHLLRLDRDSRRDRFNGSLCDDWVAKYAERSVHDGTVILAYFEDGTIRGAAELHQADLVNVEPEVAFSVESCMRRKGVGSILFTQLIAKARSMGYKKLRVTTGAQNDAMRALAGKFGAKLSFRHGESTGLIDLTAEPVKVAPKPKAGAADVAKAVGDYNRAAWRAWFNAAGFGKH